MLLPKPIASPLHVIAVVSNPVRFKSRYHLFRQFKEYVQKSGAVLHVVEQAFGERLHEVIEPTDPNHHLVRTGDELWHKENLINIGITKLPHDWKYVAWVDADVQFSRPDWVQETLQQLQHHWFVQMFSSAVDLGPNDEIIQQHKGFVYSWYQGRDAGPGSRYESWHPGYAWAACREAIDYVGGLIDWGIAGSGDRHMACAMIGKVDVSFHREMFQRNRNYVEMCREWQARSERYVRRDIGYVDTLLMHYWHGKKRDRGYKDRWRILVDNEYDPALDLKRDWQGLYQLTDRSIGLRDDLRKYFRSRNEDSIDL